MKKEALKKEALMLTLLKLILLLLMGLTLSLEMSAVQAATTTPKGFVMAIQSTPAICMFDPNRTKKRKCLEGYSLNINGLFPESDQKKCTTNSSAELNLLQAKVVARVMPDEYSRQKLWKDIGGCTGVNASQYFRTIINFSERLKVPAIMTGQQTQETQLNTLRSMFMRLNSGLSGDAIRFQCKKLGQNAYLTEINFCYKTNGQYKSCPNQVVSNCPDTFLIKGSY